ncbi:hypothetical protein [Dokdonella ginsengisoli]|uniref:Uncharacterized protein n=1 Tax=Dokdonella ginsengisoli TaxID=363846 RepID=A0ABV9QZ19_9GAMM
MRVPRARLAAFVVATAASWLLLVLWAAGAGWSTPPAPQLTREFAGREFQPVFGTAAAQDDRLQVTAAAEDYSALQSTALANVAGEELPILRYRFENFPRTLELTLVFRTAEQPDDVQTIALPWPGSGEASFDLSRIEAWRGTIVELGFAQFAAAQLVAPERGFAPFTLVSVGLESDSWAGRIRALLTGWSLLTPWQLISVSAVGPSEVGDSSPHAPRLPLVLALALGLAAVWARLVLGWSGRRLGGGLLVVAALAWVVADAAWLRSLAYKRSVDRDVWGDVPLAQRQDHVVDAELRDAATHLKQMLVNAPPTTRILVDADSPHDVLRLTYLASPLNIGAYGELALAGGRAVVPVGTILVRHGEGKRLRPVGNRLRVGKQSVRVRTMLETDGLAVYRVEGVSP